MPALADQRCVQHPHREAVARCPSCGGTFCRECVVEHAGRLLCARCLAKESARPGVRREIWRGLPRLLAAAAGMLLLWFLFYATGVLALKIPAEFHEGTIWKSRAGHSP